MKEPKFLTITGLDGSGKTTLANNIIEFYKTRGYKYKYDLRKGFSRALLRESEKDIFA